jgi:signal transduction histidine kinase
MFEMPRDTGRQESDERSRAPQPEGRLGDVLEGILAVAPGERSLRRLVGALAEAVPAADSAALVTSDGDRLELAAAVGLDDEIPELGALAQRVIASNRVETAGDPGPPFPAGTRVGCAAPLPGENGPRGVLLLGSRTTDRFSPDVLVALRVAADRAALALAAARLRAERDEAAERHRLALEELAARRNAIDHILGIVGHDLRNPLGAVHMSAALLQKRGGLEGWQARTVERVRSSAGRMSRIIADLLSYTRTRLGTGIPIDRRPTRLDDVVRRCVDELQAANPDRAIVIAVEGDVAGEWDPDRLEQVISNLVSNAIDHGAIDQPVRVALHGSDDVVTAEVENHGDPFPPEVLAHLFEPFSRPPEAKQRKGSGLGLGLFISREIVRGHGGDIEARSDDGRTVITVRLPRLSTPRA